MSSAFFFNLDQSNILSSGNGITNPLTVIVLTGTKYIMRNDPYAYTWSVPLSCTGHVLRRLDLSYMTHHCPLVWGDCSIMH